MKRTSYVVQVEGRSQAKRWALRLGIVALLSGAAAVAVAASPHVWSDGDTLRAADLNGNFSAIDTRITSVEQQLPHLGLVARSAQSSGVVAPNVATWTPIPGLTVTFTLSAPSLVQMSGNGGQRATDSTATTFCQTGYRYVVDGTPRGNTDWGQRIQISRGDVSLHAVWSLIDAATLSAGQHTVSVEARHPSAGATTLGGSCYICGEGDGGLAPYDGCSLNVIGVPQ
jgi:hypothetical protein